MGVKRNGERDLSIWEERKTTVITLKALAEKHGVTRERIRQIVSKEDRRRARRAHFNELRKQREGASYGG